MRSLLVVAALADVMPCGSHHRPPAPPPAYVNRTTPEGVVEGIVRAANTGRTEGLSQLCLGARDTWPPVWSHICAISPANDDWSTFVIGWSQARVLDAKVAGAKATVDLAFGKDGAERRVLTLTKTGDNWFLEDLR
jgi:hypothetical protein